tara:strand:- start:1482 stop:1646 length:165 start_codon:yes stop_codon:yes gene_type:complete
MPGTCSYNGIVGTVILNSGMEPGNELEDYLWAKNAILRIKWLSFILKGAEHKKE